MANDYEVGYGKPPKNTQFQKGRSGNPAGKRKGTKNIGTLLKEALNKKVTVRDGDKTRRISKGEAFVETIVNDSLKGDNQARRVFVSMARSTGELQVAPENKMRMGGVLRLGPMPSPEEVEKRVAENQRKYREAPSPDVKKPGSDDPKKK